VTPARCFFFAVWIFRRPTCECCDFAAKHSIHRKFAPIASGLNENASVLWRDMPGVSARATRGNVAATMETANCALKSLRRYMFVSF